MFSFLFHVLKFCAVVVGMHYIASAIIDLFSVIYAYHFAGKRSFKTDGEWAVVTGATDGIGKAVAAELTTRGLKVLLVARDPQKLEEVANEMRKAVPDTEVDTLTFDFSSTNFAPLEKIKNLNVGVLFNNVGVSYPSALRFDELSSDFVAELVSVNLAATMHLSHLVYSGMTQRRKGTIVTTGTYYAHVPAPLYAGYAAVKAGVESFTKNLALEAKEHNVRVHCHVPLFVATKMTKIRKTSLTVPSPADYARWAVRTTEAKDDMTSLPVTFSPYWSHAVIACLTRFVPEEIIQRLTYSMNVKLREKYLSKDKPDKSE